MSDIVTQLRMRPSIIRKNAFGDLETDRVATKLFDEVHALGREAADEIERLRAEVAQRTAERDEARRRSCLDRARAERSDNPSLALINHSRIIAKRRGWDCFDKKEERCPG